MSLAKCVGTAFAVVIIGVGVVWSIMFPKTKDILSPDFVASVALGLGLIVAGLLIFFMTKSRALSIVLSILLMWSVLCNICLCAQLRAYYQLVWGLLEAERSSARRCLRMLESGEEDRIERLAERLRRVAGEECEGQPTMDDVTGTSRQIEIQKVVNAGVANLN